MPNGVDRIQVFFALSMTAEKFRFKRSCATSSVPVNWRLRLPFGARVHSVTSNTP